jgi:arginyl-tRNA synthetase
MKQVIREMIGAAVARAHRAGALPTNATGDFVVEAPKLDHHGDLASNVALVSAKLQRMAPRRLAEILLAHLDDLGQRIARTEIAGPGFINFFLRPSAWHPLLADIHRAGERYGASDAGGGQRVQVEFVSANPTGPLHVGHGRGAAVGDTLANILAAAGYQVQREYYINDSGRQIRTLGMSVYRRYAALCGRAVDFPEDGYQGDYIRDLAAQIRQTEGDALLDKDEAAAVDFCARHAAGSILEGIRKDLEDFGVQFDQWYSEQSLFDEGRVDAALEELRRRGIVYEKDGAQWCRTSQYGDEKDRVVVRQNGLTTYFASDIAYHRDKYARGFDRVIDVWGADHHGYVARMTAAIEASGQRRDQFQVVLVHLVNLLRGGQPVPMSTRAGEFVTLAEVVAEVGRDAARFIFLTRHHESALDFDLELAKQETNDNPVYYVQYVHARIASILRKAAEDYGIAGVVDDSAALATLVEPEEVALIKAMADFPETVAIAAAQLEPHRVTFFLMELAAAFHTYYNRHRVLAEDPLITRGRLFLVATVQQVIARGLGLLGVSAPERM